MHSRMFLFVNVFACTIAGPAVAEMVEMVATLSGAHEVPPVESAGHGSAEMTIDTETGEFRWKITAEGLSAPLSAAHFHGPSTTLQNAGVEVPIAKKGDTSPFVGSAKLDAEQMADLIDGYWYINVHTPTHPPGEIRGQVYAK